jgi:hypothetical protein
MLATKTLAQSHVEYTYDIERHVFPTDINVEAEVDAMIQQKIAQGYAKADVEKNRETLTRAFTNMRNGTTREGTVSLLCDGNLSYIKDIVTVTNNDGQVLQVLELFDGTYTWRDSESESAVLVLAGDKREHLATFADRLILGRNLGLAQVPVPESHANRTGASAFRYPSGVVDVLVPLDPERRKIDVYRQLNSKWRVISHYEIDGEEAVTIGSTRRTITVTKFSQDGVPVVKEVFKLKGLAETHFPSRLPSLTKGRSILDVRRGDALSETYFWEGKLKSLDLLGEDDRPNNGDAGVLLRAGAFFLAGLVAVIVGLRSLRNKRPA